MSKSKKAIIGIVIAVVALALVLAPILVITGNKKKAEEEKVAALKQQAAQFDATVVSIGAVTLEDENTIVAARATYDGFTDETKGYTTKYKMLTTAEEQLATLLSARKQDTEKTDKAVSDIKNDVAKVTEQLNAIKTAKANNTAPSGTFDKALITNARNTYNSLTSEERASVPTETVKALEDAEAEIARQEQEAQEAAAKAAEEEAARKAQEQKELEEKQRAEAERAAEEARQAEAARRAEEAKQAANTEQPSGGNTGNTGNTGNAGGGDAEVGKWGEAPEGYTQEQWNSVNEGAEKTFGGGGIPRPGELKF